TLVRDWGLGTGDWGRKQEENINFCLLPIAFFLFPVPCSLFYQLPITNYQLPITHLFGDFPHIIPP
ncbi:hypothetical protein, partial [Sphaerospermopsis aphanizomenoides]|uniref:hypothetical protein n=1 Tax=Sphaerospermopsis aphanizomenoides TaxID=459663 RepID=UPI001D155E05